MSGILKGFLAGMMKSAAVAGEVAVETGVKGKERDLSGCTPCAGAAIAVHMHEKNLKMMGQAPAKKAKKRKTAAAPAGARRAPH